MKYIVSASAGEIYIGNITKIQATGAANSSGSLTKVEFGTTHISSSQVYKIKVSDIKLAVKKISGVEIMTENIKF